MPKVQDLIATPKPNVKKPAKGADAKSTDATDFRRTLEGARNKKNEPAPAETRKPEQAAKTKRAKTNATAKRNGEPEATDAAEVDVTAEETDVAEPPAVVVAEEEPVAESPETNVQETEAKAHSTNAPNAGVVAAAVVQAPMMAASEDVVATTDVEAGDEPQAPVAARPAKIATAKVNAVTPEDVAQALSDDAAPAITGEQAPVDEDPIEEPASSTPAIKHSTKPAPSPSPAPKPVADVEEKATAKPNAAPSLEALEQSVAAFDDSQPSTTTSAAPTGVADSTATASTLATPATSADRSITTSAPHAAPAPQPPVTAQSFAEVNHPNIVTSVRAELLPTGGMMQIRLDPPELGALQVLVHMHDGAMTASFQTSNDDATKLLSHSLGQLKQVLESQGVSVDKLHVQQAPRDQQASNDDQRQQQQHDREDESARHEQQRKEMLRRMWRRLSGNHDPLDLVA